MAAPRRKRLSHPDLADIFRQKGSSFGLGVDGLNRIFLDHFGDEIEELFEESNFEEEPRRLDEITAAEQELFDRIWYHRSLQHEYRLCDQGDDEQAEREVEITAGAATGE